MHIQPCTVCVEDLHFTAPVLFCSLCNRRLRNGCVETKILFCVLLAKSVFSPAEQWVVPAHTRISLVDWLRGTICARSLNPSLHLYSTLFPCGWCSPT